MKIAIMQPYFFPYIGYFQLIGAVDVFVIYDNIKYTKKGWINRNRALRNGADFVFTVPLRGDSDALDVRERSLAADFDRRRLANQLREAYRRAPYFDVAFPVIEKAIMLDEANLFEYVRSSVEDVCRYCGLGTRIVASSTFVVDPGLKAEDKVLALCTAAGAGTYVNAIGGTRFFSAEQFAGRGIQLKFLRTRPIEYPQFGDPFIPSLSIIDVMMFNPAAKVREMLDTCYDLVEG